MLQVERTSEVIGSFVDLGLVSAAEQTEALAFFHPGVPFPDAMAHADSMHLHIRVDDTVRLPRSQILSLGGKVENETAGYVKFAFAGGVNIIFSSISVAEEDSLSGASRPKPYLDHVGVDMRDERDEVREIFDRLPQKSLELGWGHTAQDFHDRPVYCCHTQVRAKHWLYPHGCSRHFVPIEFAHGPLKVSPNKMGCDLRPIDPSDPRAAEVKPCCAAH